MPVPMVTPTWLVLFGEMALQPTHVYYCCYCHCSTARSYLSSQGLPCSWWQRECNGSLRCWQVLGWECSSRPSGCQPGGTQIPSGRFYGQTIPLFGCFLQTSLRVTSYINSLQLNLLLNDISKRWDDWLFWEQTLETNRAAGLAILCVFYMWIHLIFCFKLSVLNTYLDIANDCSLSLYLRHYPPLFAKMVVQLLSTASALTRDMNEAPEARPWRIHKQFSFCPHLEQISYFQLVSIHLVLSCTFQLWSYIAALNK